MKHLLLKRIHTGDFGTFGELMVKDHPPFALTLEPPDKNNAPNISCIPAGDYLCYPVNSPRFGKTWEVVDVPGRTHILFHAGNTAAPDKSDTLGCVMVAKKHHTFNGIPGILNKKGLAEFKEIVEGEEVVKLSITEHY